MTQLKREHHCFVQAVLARGYVEETEAKTMFRGISEQNHDRNFDTFWSAINSAIQLADLKLQRLRYPYDNTTYIGIVNTLADDPSKLATHFTPEQIAYFRTLMERIATDEDGGVSGLDSRTALNLSVTSTSATQGTQAAKKLTIGDKEALLQQLSADGWLHSDRGTFKLGVRTFLELGTYLHSLELSERTKELWADLI